MKQTRLIPFDIEKAKNGAKIVTRHGLYPVRIGFYDLEDTDLPIVAAIKKDRKEIPYQFTIEGNFYPSKEEDGYDLFIEEEEEETDDYNPYKATVESIAEIAEHVISNSFIDLRDFYDNVKVKCKEAIEYDKKWCKKQDEKPADNKPKFQEGDWVTDIDKPGVVHQITDVIKNVNHTYGYNAVSFTYGFFGYSYFSEKVKSMRLWTIQDAKPGDILATKNGYNILIFKNIKSSSGSGFSSYYNYNNFSDYSDFKEGSWNRDRFIPATKEQRDLLFKKIKEAGYEWDSDKKEFHKIGEVKTRQMTHQELADWLRDAPEEHREFKYTGGSDVFNFYEYVEDEANVPVANRLIRRNHGEWEEPLIEE